MLVALLALLVLAAASAPAAGAAAGPAPAGIGPEARPAPGLASLALPWPSMRAQGAPVAVPPTEAGAYQVPVDAPVASGFSVTSAYGPGQRGLRFATDGGEVVRAAAGGVVTFASSVAGDRWVTVLHPDGRRTTYGPMAGFSVAVGDVVDAGVPVGTVAGALTFTVRVGDTYLDPAPLFGDQLGVIRVRLVPLADAPRLPAWPQDGGGNLLHRAARFGVKVAVGGIDALQGLAGHVERGVLVVGGKAIELTDRTVGALQDLAVTLVREGHRAAVALAATVDDLTDAARALMELYADAVALPTEIALATIRSLLRECTPGSVPVAPPSDAPERIAVQVGGLGSSSTDASVFDVQTTTLGYDPERVVRFSYNGGRTATGHPALHEDLLALDVTDYRPIDTSVDLREAGARLAELLQAVAASDPKATIDVQAHSMGGIVTRAALAHLDREGDRATLDRLGLVTTMGSPHQGVPMAAAARDLTDNLPLLPGVGGVLGPVGSSIGRTVAPVVIGAVVEGQTSMPMDATSIRQLAPGSDLLRELEAAGLPEGVAVLSIGSTYDLVVPNRSTELDGATNVVVLDGEEVPLVGLVRELTGVPVELAFPGSDPGGPVQQVLDGVGAVGRSVVNAHGDLPSSDQATREVLLALDGRPPGCDEFWREGANVLADFVAGVPMRLAVVVGG